ncbi:MAG: hypothetical protein F6K28_57270, partial [Microcoleus sp. SIO2G3]|nr:hypothetical protein [Microcoleus sp. SIO2G3]
MTIVPTPIRPKPSEDYPETIDNHAVLNELETVKDRLEDDELREYTTSIDNQETLQQLEDEKDQLSAWAATIFSGSILAGLTTFSIGMLGILLAWKPMTRLEKVARLIKLIQAILDEFEQWGVEVLPLIRVPRYQPIDLFVRFPGKEFLLFAIRSHGESVIVYNEAKQCLYQKRSPRGMSRWKPDPLVDLSEQAYWLRKNRRELFGSSKGVRKPMAKVLVLWGQTQLDQHREHLYATLGGKKFLFIPREGGACYVIHQSQVIHFVRAW